VSEYDEKYKNECQDGEEGINGWYGYEHIIYYDWF